MRVLAAAAEADDADGVVSAARAAEARRV